MTRFLTGQSSFRPALAAVILSTITTACSGADALVARGEQLFDTCAPCHGDEGEGDEILGAPAIAGASQWYLNTQIDKFRSGQRGYHYMDTEGLRMRPMSRALIAEDEDIEAVIAYVYSLPIPDPPATAEGDVATGEEDYLLLCANCHGRDGRGLETLAAPSLLHLGDWYIASSLRKYRDGIRGAGGDGFGANMRAAMTGFTDERIDDVTAYIMTMQRLPRRAPAPPPPPLEPLDVDPAILPEGVTVAMAQEGQEIFNGNTGICFTCHLREGPGGPLAPNLTDDVWLNIDGEYESIVDIIMTGVPQPVEHPGLMQPRAGMPLTDEQVRAVAAYVYTLSR